MPSRTKGRRVRVPFVIRCSVRQYAYQDITSLSKAGQRRTGQASDFETTLLVQNQEKGQFYDRAGLQPASEVHLTPGESRNATISLHSASPGLGTRRAEATHKDCLCNIQRKTRGHAGPG